MTPEQFFNQDIARVMRRDGVRRIVPIEIDVCELLDICREKGLRVLNPSDLSNETSHIKDNIGRWAIVSDYGNFEVLFILFTKVESGVESPVPYILDRHLHKFKEAMFS